MKRQRVIFIAASTTTASKASAAEVATGTDNDKYVTPYAIKNASVLTLLGNLTVSGTLGVTGAATLSSTLGVTGNVAVNTNKFTVAAASGNTVVAGTLGVTGASTLSSVVTDTITGNPTISGNVVVSGSDGLTLSSGIANFKMQTGTGLYLDGGGNTYISEQAADKIRLVTGGTTSADFTATAVTVTGNLTVSGMVTAVPNNGFLNWGNGNVGWQGNSTSDTAILYTGGSNRLQVSNTATTVGGNLTVSGTGVSIFAGTVQLKNGTEAAPSTAWAAGSNTGFYNYNDGSASGFGFSVAGAWALRLSSTALQTTKVLNVQGAGTSTFAGPIGGNEIADPDAPAANNGILYFRDNGGGKTQLCARFATGAIQVIATEP